MGNLEQFINDESMDDLDLLVKMAVSHYQFESIHPFYDGNGRTYRLLKRLCVQGLLVKEGKGRELQPYINRKIVLREKSIRACFAHCAREYAITNNHDSRMLLEHSCSVHGDYA